MDNFILDLQPELLYNLTSLPEEFLALLDFSDPAIKTNSIQENAIFLISQIEPLLQTFERTNPSHQSVFYCYYLLLCFGDKLKKLMSFITTPGNLTEYTYYYYAKFILGDFYLDKKLFESLLETHDLDQISRQYFEILIEEVIAIKSISDQLALYEQFFEKHKLFFFRNYSLTILWLRKGLGLLRSDYFLNLINELLTFAEKMNFEYAKMHLLFMLGYYYNETGHINQATALFTQSMNVFNERSYPLLTNQLKFSLAYSYYVMGREEQALQIIQELYKQQPGSIDNLNALLTFYFQKDEYLAGTKLILDFEATYGSLKNFKAKINLVAACGLFLQADNLEKAHELLQYAQEIADEFPFVFHKFSYSFMVALVNQYEGNLLSAKQKTEECITIMNSFNKDVNTTFFVYKQYIKIQLDLVNSRPSNKEYKQQLFSIIETLLNLVEEQELVYQKLMVLLIRSEIYRFYGLVIEANVDVRLAKELSSTYELGELFDHTVKELQKIDQFHTTTLEPDIKDSTFLSRLKDALGVLLGNPIATSRYIKVKYTLHGVLILSNTGLAIFHHYFTDLLESDPNLISGLILAITTFISEISKGDGLLKSINHDDLSVILEPLDNFLCVSIATRDCYEVREKTRRFTVLSKKIVLDNLDGINKGIITTEMKRKLAEAVKEVF